jgi:hypothetical protein
MRTVVVLAAAVAAMSGSALGQIKVTNNNNANALLTKLVGGNPKLTVTNVTLSGNSDGFGGMSTGTYDVQGPNAYDLGRGGIVLSTGNAEEYGSGPNNFTDNQTDFFDVATPGEELLLAPLDGFGSQHFDVTRLDITFDVEDFDLIQFDVVFASEEWSEFVGLGFTDPFGLYLNGKNIAFAGGQPVNIDNSNMMSVPETELDGVLSIGGSPLITYSGAVTPFSKGNTMTFIIADSTDGIYDTTVYITGLVPTPGAAGVLGVAGLIATRRRRD